MKITYQLKTLFYLKVLLTTEFARQKEMSLRTYWEHYYIRQYLNNMSNLHLYDKSKVKTWR